RVARSSINAFSRIAVMRRLLKSIIFSVWRQPPDGRGRVKYLHLLPNRSPVHSTYPASFDAALQAPAAVFSGSLPPAPELSPKIVGWLIVSAHQPCLFRFVPFLSSSGRTPQPRRWSAHK